MAVKVTICNLIDGYLTSFLLTLNCRQTFNCYIINCCRVSLHRWSHSTVSTELLDRLLPGPVTLVFNRRETLNPALNPNKETVGTRVPDSPFIVQLAKAFDGPIGLTSANLSSEKSTLCVEVITLKQNITLHTLVHQQFFWDLLYFRSLNAFGLNLIWSWMEVS